MGEEHNRKGLPKKWLIFGLATVVLMAAPFVLSPFRLNLLGKFLAYAIVALGIDLIWGYTGMLSLGQGLFFGLGAYSAGMFLKLEAAAGDLPDFMAWSGIEKLPWFWAPFGHAWFAIAMAVLIPMIVSALVGYPVFRSRIRGPYFAIITQALALIFTIFLVGQQPYSGGTNGITNFETVFGFPLSSLSTQRAVYFLTVLVLGCVFLLCRRLTGSRFGRLLIAIRDGENRVRFSGYDPVKFKVFVFALSAGLAGLAGAVFVPRVGIISPAMIGIVPSIEMVMWVAVGGRGTLTGAVLGAVLVNMAKSYLSESFPSAWLYSLGTLFIGVVAFFPDGIMGLLAKMSGRR